MRSTKIAHAMRLDDPKNPQELFQMLRSFLESWAELGEKIRGKLRGDKNKNSFFVALRD